MIPADDTFNGTFPFRPRFTQAPGFQMHYVDEGEGEPIVCLHGEPTWAYLYRHFIPPLSKRHRVIVSDHMGFGRSERDCKGAINFPLDFVTGKWARFQAGGPREVEAIRHKPAMLAEGCVIERFSRRLRSTTSVQRFRRAPSSSYKMRVTFARKISLPYSSP